MTDKIACPRCGQGWVRDVWIRPMQRHVFACEECDATWMNVVAIGIESYIDLGTCVVRHGYDGIVLDIDVRGFAIRDGS